mmetsp:Transcript_82641/g.212897  ORF Transcript_82641/g.212897 Transcript_82641/m.212897 type:complete len:352 (+) Transcript_82641:79-1134(+)
MQSPPFSMIRSDMLEVVLVHMSARGRGRLACVSTSSAALLRARFPSQPYGTRLTVWGGEQWEVLSDHEEWIETEWRAWVQKKLREDLPDRGVFAFRHHSTQATVLLRYSEGSRHLEAPNAFFIAMRCGRGGAWMRYQEDLPDFHPGHAGLGGFFQDMDRQDPREAPLDRSRDDTDDHLSLFKTISKDCGKYRVTLESLDGLEAYRTTSRTVFRHCSVTEDGNLAVHFTGPRNTALRLELSRSGAALFFTSAKDWPIPDAKEQVRVGLRFYTPAEKSSYCTACGAIAGSLGAWGTMMPRCKPCRDASEQESVPSCTDCGAISGSFGAWGGPGWWCQACWEAYDKSFQRGAAR